ncbi:MAG: apolipoprotein N-acyltransferase [Candidatus Omnitrophica bacterium]|nr:apolipoprotein N-acyltransferase [Candidatus Omnitrophota bacterium]
MIYSLSHIVNRLSLAAISAVFLILSFPDFNLGFLAWFALVPLLFAIDGQKPFKAFLISYVTGLFFFLGVLYWLIHVTLPGMVVVSLYLGLYFGLFGVLLALVMKPGTKTNNYELLFLIPSIWVILEWIRSHLLTGFGWALLGYSQSDILHMIQIADITGVYGVGFLLVLMNAAIFFTVRDVINKRLDTGFVVVAIFLVFLASGYGVIRLKNVFTGETIKVAVVQGNIPQDRKWDSDFRDGIIETYLDLTGKAALDRPDLIVWPETSVPGFLEIEDDLKVKVLGTAKRLKIPLLVGTIREDKDSNYYNSAALVLPTGEMGGVYDKVHLVPFGEYIPFKKALSFVEKFAPVPIGDCSFGSSYTILGFFIERKSSQDGASMKLLKKVKFACLICFEDIFPELSREFVKKGAGFLVNMTNDAWYKRSGALAQHAQNSVFRAVENRTNVIRSANTGLSCFIDQKGRIIDKIEMYEPGFKTCDIILNRARTFYSVYGDVLVYAAMLFFTASLIKRRGQG